MAAEKVIAVHSVEAWTEQMNQAKESNKLVVIDFTATWCGPCRFIAPYFAELANRFLDVIFLKVDVDELESVAEDCNIKAMPTFIFMKEGQTVDKVGCNKTELEKKILQYSVSCVIDEDIYHSPHDVRKPHMTVARPVRRSARLQGRPST